MARCSTRGGDFIPISRRARPHFNRLILAQSLVPLLDLDHLLAARREPRKTVAEAFGGPDDCARIGSGSDAARFLCFGCSDAKVDAAKRNQPACSLVGIDAQQIAAALQQPHLLPFPPVATIGELEPCKRHEVEDPVGGDINRRG